MSDHPFQLRAGDDWKIQQVKVSVDATLRGGNPEQPTIDFIEGRIRQCPVTVNMNEPSEYQIALRFS